MRLSVLILFALILFCAAISVRGDDYCPDDGKKSGQCQLRCEEDDGYDYGKDKNRCSLLCVKEAQCASAVYDSSTQKCSLLYKVVSVTTSSQPNDLVYLQNVCPRQIRDKRLVSPPKAFKDCQDAFEYGERTSGVYKLTIQGYGSFKVWCNFDDDHGWTVFQRRQDGSVDFFLNWDDYKNGFGDIYGEYWLGNDNIYELTKTNQKLHIYLEAADGTHRNAYYSQFYIEDESDFYKMTLSKDDYSGDAQNKFSRHDQAMFSTKDKDHDTSSIHCAMMFKGGWWYNKVCYGISLNGVYVADADSTRIGIGYGGSWKASLPKVTMELSRDSNESDCIV